MPGKSPSTDRRYRSYAVLRCTCLIQPTRKSLGPPACIHPSRIERPTEIDGRLCLIQVRAVQGEACTSMCLSDAIQHEHSRPAATRSRLPVLTGLRYGGSRVGFRWSHCAGIGRKNCIAGVSSGPAKQRLAWTAHVIARNQLILVAVLRRRLWRWNPVHIPQHSRTYSIAREKLVGADRSPEA